MLRKPAIVFMLCLLPGAAGADIYAYQDAQGRIRITDIPEKKGYELVLPPVRSAPAGTVNLAATAAASNPAPVAAAASDPTAYRAALKTTPPARLNLDDLRAVVAEAARLYGLSESLLYAVIRTESNFNPYAVSRAGALGLMQLIPSTARLVGVTRPFDMRQNVHGGAKYLRMMIDRFGRVDHALAAYNAGPEAVERHGGIPPYAETLAYVPRVLRYYREYNGGTLPTLTTRPRPQSAAAAAARKPATRSRGAAGASGGTAPIFYYRGPDGQIYITNLNNGR